MTVEGKNLWAATIPEVQQGKWFFRQLWSDGQRQKRSRHPNKGYLQIAEVPDATPQTKYNQGQRRFRFNKGDLRAWRSTTDAELIVMTLWTESRLPASIDEAQTIINLERNSVFRLNTGNLYYIENVFETLDNPREWYLERKTGKLYYLPLDKEDIRSTEIIAPVFAHLLVLKGKAEASQWVEHLYFEELIFAHEMESSFRPS